MDTKIKTREPRTAIQKLSGFFCAGFVFVLFSIDGVFLFSLHADTQASLNFVCGAESYTSVANFLVQPDLLAYARKQCLLPPDLLVAKLLFLKFKIMLCAIMAIICQILRVTDFVVCPSSLQQAIKDVEEKGGLSAYSRDFWAKAGPITAATVLLLAGFPFSRTMEDFDHMAKIFMVLGTIFFFISLYGISAWIISALAYSIGKASKIDH